jgi:hypothetical protein
MWGNTRNDVAFFTASGRVALLPIHQIPDGQDTRVSSLVDWGRSETVVGAVVLPHPAEETARPELFLTMATHGGRIKRVTLEDLAPAASRGSTSAMNIEAGDQLAWIEMTGGETEIVLVTRQGKAIRFSESDVRPMGLSATGVWAIKLGTDDAVVGMGIVREDTDVVLFSEEGYAKRTPVRSFPVQKRYGGGVQAAKLSSRTGPLAVATLADERQDVVLLADKGRVIKLPVKAIHSLGRSAAGQRSRQDTKEPYLNPTKHGQPTLLAVLAGTKKAAERARAQTEQFGRAKATKRKPPAKKATRAQPTQQSPGKTAALPSKAAEPAKKQPVANESSPEHKETAAGKEFEAATQMPLPIKTPPKSTGKTKPRKRGTVRSVPKPKSQ